MVLATGVAIPAAAMTGPGGIAGAAVGVTAGAEATIEGGNPALARAVGIGISGGAIAGAAATALLIGTGAPAGALAGGTSALAVGCTGQAFGELAEGKDPLKATGKLTVGTSQSSFGHLFTYDCWKPVIRDTSVEPSNGMSLEDLMGHPNIAKVTVTRKKAPEFPNIILENIWSESFQIEYLMFIESGKIVCHADPINSFK